MKLLVADDDAHLLKGLVELLTRAGFDCVGVEDGERALVAFRQDRPALCLLDVLMPAMDGLSLCREIRDLDARVPIILLSARDAEIDRVIGLEIGADDYIVKPFGPRELVARIKVALRRAAGGISVAPSDAVPSDDFFAMGDLRVEPTALRAFRGRQSIDLSRRETTILRIFSTEAANRSRATICLILPGGRILCPIAGLSINIFPRSGARSKPIPLDPGSSRRCMASAIDMTRIADRGDELIFD